MDSATWEEQDALPARERADARIRMAISRVARSTPLARGLLILLCLAMFLPGFFQLPAVDADEARFVQTSRQMLETGNLIDPRLHDEPRYKKPIGIYWLQYAMAEVTGFGADAPVWVYRLVSLLAAIAAVQLTYSAGRRFLTPEAGLVAAVLLGSCIILGAEARLAKTDATLLATVCASQLALWALYAKGARAANEPAERFVGWPLLFWVALGVGTLIKGPITPMVSGLTALALVGWDRKAGWLRRLRPLPGTALMALIVLPWLIAIAVISKGQFFEASVGEDLLAKVGEGMDAHGAPPGTHLMLFWLTFWPGALLLVPALPLIWRRRGEPAIRFLVSWIVPTFVVFELVVTKLPHYTLPTYPAIALLIGLALVGAPGPDKRWWARLLTAIAGLIGVALAVAVILTLHDSEGEWSPLAMAIGGVAGAVALAEIWLAASGLIRGAAVLLVAEAALVYATAFGVVIPAMQTLWPSPRLADAAVRVAGCANPDVMSAGYAEASIVFAVGTDIRFGDGSQAADFLGQPGCRAVIVADTELGAFQARLAADGGMAGTTETIKGMNLRTARKTTFTVMGRVDE